MANTAALKASIKDKLSETHAGAKLGGGLVDIVVNYLVDEVEIKDVNEVVVKDLLSTAKEAWADAKDGSDLPAMHVISHSDVAAALRVERGCVGWSCACK